MKFITTLLFAMFGPVLCAERKWDTVPGYWWETQGDETYEKYYCWRLSAGNEKARIVLSDCDRKDERQLFFQESCGVIGDSNYIEFRPKLYRKYKVGVQKEKAGQRLRLVDSSGYTKFYLDEHGLLGIGKDSEEEEGMFSCSWEWWSARSSCLFVTNLGKYLENTNIGDSVLLKKKGQIKKMMYKNPQLITSWIYG